MELTDRIDRLEKLYEKLYHESELLAIYIPRLTDILIEYWVKTGEYRGSIRRDLIKLRDLAKMNDTDIGGLKKGYHTHLDKKPKVEVSEYD